MATRLHHGSTGRGFIGVVALLLANAISPTAAFADPGVLFVSPVIHRLDDHRHLPADASLSRWLHRAGEVVWWQGVAWGSLLHGDAARPEVVVEGHLDYSPDWSPIWDEHAPPEQT